jgi:hypothetical protein
MIHFFWGRIQNGSDIELNVLCRHSKVLIGIELMLKKKWFTAVIQNVSSLFVMP